MDRPDEPDIGLALAALALCESLMVSLIDKGVLKPHEFEEILETARDSHANASPGTYSVADHRRAANILRMILHRSNGIRGSSRL
ncbi:MAG: hypothetical protein RLO50_01125 [Azospirillaceae bacterium]